MKGNIDIVRLDYNYLYNNLLSKSNCYCEFHQWLVIFSKDSTFSRRMYV